MLSALTSLVDGQETFACVQPLRGRREVEVWLLQLPVAAPLEAKYWDSLSEDEKTRAQRFRFDSDRRRFVGTRGRLRELAGQYLSVDPQALTFVYGREGKPELARGSELQFNVAHSGDYALLAFAASARVGVDLEKLRSMADASDLARRYFCPEEYRELMALDESEREEAFFSVWTRKEALLKASGNGLSGGLDRFHVPLGEMAAAQLLEAPRGKYWTVLDLVVPQGYRGALVVEGKAFSLKAVNRAGSQRCESPAVFA
jgi:4'-phosphopantetheinyl transferase